MPRISPLLGGLLAVGLACLAATRPLTAQPWLPENGLHLISIATGNRSGLYYFTGGRICALVNAGRWTHGTRCLAQSSGGSVDNLRALRAGRVDFAIAQSDWQHHAVAGTDVFAAAGPDRSLRAIMALYPEPFTVIARADAGIAEFADLEGKRVAIGTPGSGTRATAQVVIASLGLAETDFAHLADTATPDLPDALCGEEIDAAVLVMAHPSRAIADIMNTCAAALIPLASEQIDALTGRFDYFAPHTIPAGRYAGQTAAVGTFAVQATLVTAARVRPALVFRVAQAIFEAGATFDEAHPALGALGPVARSQQGLSAPRHVGALRYFRTIGLPAEGG